MTLVLPEQERLPVRTAAGFARIHGYAPALVSRAPGRVNLIGEHTDYNGGPCLPLALPHATCAAAAPRTDGLLRATTSSAGQPRLEVPVSSLTPGAVTGWGAYVAGVVWALREAGVAVPGLDLHVDSTVPPGAGLGSSAALTAAVALAAAGLTDPDLAGATGGPGRGATPGRGDRPLRGGHLLAASLRAEREFAGAPTGGMDQTTVLRASTGHALLLDFATDPPAERHVPLAPVTAEHALLVLDSGVRHAHTGGEYGTRRAECEEAARQLGVVHLAAAASDALAALPPGVARSRATHVVTETARVARAVAALEAGDTAALGALLWQSHVSLRDDFAASGPALDLLVDTARAHGALGARLTGGGFGGSVVALVPRAREQAVQHAVEDAARAAGAPAPALLPVTTAAPAAVVPRAAWSDG